MPKEKTKEKITTIKRKDTINKIKTSDPLSYKILTNRNKNAK